MTTDAPLDDPAARPSLASSSTHATPANTGQNADATVPERHMHAVEEPAADGSPEAADGADQKPAEPHASGDSEQAARAAREAIAARAFQVYSDHVTATARSMHETPAEELHRRHDQAANKARHGLNIGHKLR